MDKPKIIKVMEKVTGLKYYELYQTIKIKNYNEINFNDYVECECGKKDLRYISKIEVNNELYNIGSSCIINIYTFLKSELSLCVDVGIEKQIKICLKKTEKVMEEFKKAIKLHKQNNNLFKKILDKQLNKFDYELEKIELLNIKQLNDIFEIEKAKINNDTFKTGKYKDKKYFQIDDNSYLIWLCKKHNEFKNINSDDAKNFYKSFNIDLINNIFEYSKKKLKPNK